MTLSEQLREEKRKLFGITYKPKQDRAICAVPKIMEKFQNKKRKFDKDTDSSCNRITRWICELYNINIEDIYSDKRDRLLADTRHKLFFLLYFTLPITQSYIAFKYNKHPSSVVHSINKVNALFINSLDFQAFIEQFEDFYNDKVA